MVTGYKNCCSVWKKELLVFGGFFQVLGAKCILSFGYGFEMGWVKVVDL